jgi:imidazolonepropionase-like amidohydrolase
LEEQQRDNQERMNAALQRQAQQGLGPATGGPMSVPTSARSAAARQNAQTSGNPAQSHQLANQQMYYGRMYHEQTAGDMKRLLPNMHHHEDQTHLLNIMFSVNKQSKRRRATASHAELSSERKYSLKEEELMQALVVHMERKGFTPDFVKAVKAGGADKAVSLSQYNRSCCSAECRRLVYSRSACTDQRQCTP